LLKLFIAAKQSYRATPAGQCFFMPARTIFPRSCSLRDAAGMPAAIMQKGYPTGFDARQCCMRLPEASAIERLNAATEMSPFQ
jgi:hypothetical protein